MRVVACRVAIITHARTLTCDLYLISALLFFLVTFCFWGTCFRVFVFFFLSQHFCFYVSHYAYHFLAFFFSRGNWQQ